MELESSVDRGEMGKGEEGINRVDGDGRAMIARANFHVVRFMFMLGKYAFLPSAKPATGL